MSQERANQTATATNGGIERHVVQGNARIVVADDREMDLAGRVDRGTASSIRVSRGISGSALGFHGIFRAQFAFAGCLYGHTVRLGTQCVGFDPIDDGFVIVCDRPLRSGVPRGGAAGDDRNLVAVMVQLAGEEDFVVVAQR